jgi:hypothetical protein
MDIHKIKNPHPDERLGQGKWRLSDLMNSSYTAHNKNANAFFLFKNIFNLLSTYQLFNRKFLIHMN